MKAAHFFIRVDAAHQIGTGHLIRCLTLAQSLSELGQRITFVCRTLAPSLADLIKEAGFTLHEVDPTTESEPASWGSCGQEWLIVDHYNWDFSLETKCRNFFQRILVIDDLANRQHECDFILDQNYFSEPNLRYKNLIPASCRTLFGPAYALLRPEFAQLRGQQGERSGRIEKILVSCGGSDPHNDTALIMQGLAQLKQDKLKVEIICGLASQNYEEIELEAKRLGFKCERGVKDMARRLGEADLFVGAGGATTWERLCLGLPSIVMAIAENQKEYSVVLGEAGYQSYLGERDQINAETISQAVAALLNNPEKCRQMSEKARSLVDGLGATRVAAILGKPA